MKVTPFFIIIATFVLTWALWSGVFGVYFDNGGESGSRLILKIDIKSEEAVAVQRVFRNTSATVGKLSNTVFSLAGGPNLVRKCKEQPVLFGGLFIFFGVSACGIGFIAYLIRTDARF